MREPISLLSAEQLLEPVGCASARGQSSRPLGREWVGMGGMRWVHVQVNAGAVAMATPVGRWGGGQVSAAETERVCVRGWTRISVRSAVDLEMRQHVRENSFR